MTDFAIHVPGEMADRVHASIAATRAAERRAAERRLPVAERLARAMEDIAAAGQTVTVERLSLEKFTAAELTEANLAKARELANRRAVRTVG